MKKGMSATRRFVFETSEHIEVNLQEERATLGFFTDPKPIDNPKPKVALPSYSEESEGI